MMHSAQILPKQSSIKTQVIGDAAMYIPSSYVAQCFGLVNAFVVRHLLGPTLMGVWATLQIILNYGGYLHLGSMQAGAKEIPYQIGRKNPEGAEAIKDNIFTFSLCMAALGALLLAAVSWLWRGDLNAPFRVGLIATGLILVGQRMYNFNVMLLRGRKNFVLLSKLTVFTAVLDLALGATLIWFFGIYGLFAAVLASLAISTAYAFRRGREKIHWRLDRPVLAGIAKIGLPMLILGIVFTLLRTIDKILVIRFCGATQLGIYSIALMASNYVYGLSNMTGILTLPRFSEHFGAKADARVLGAHMQQANYVLAVLLSAILGVLFFLAPLLIRLFLKAYIPGIPAMQMLLLGTFFLCLLPQPQNFLLAVGKQVSLLMPIGLGVGICFVLNFWALWAGKGLLAVALATSASYLATFLALFAVAARATQGAVPFWKSLFPVLAPFAYAVGVMFALEQVFAGVQHLWVLPAKLLLFTLSQIYCVAKVDKQTHVVRKGWEMFWGKAAVVMKWRGRRTA